MSGSPQFIRTDKAIMQALITLLRQKPFEKITVQDILEETPVTRATFYAHYHDKYEIVEKMLEQFFSMYGVIRSELLAAPASHTHEIIQKNFFNYRDFMEALLKVHTEKVDLRQSIVRELEKEYLAASDSPSKKMEARIYAQALTEFHLSYLDEEHPPFALDHINHIFVSVALKLLNLSDDKEAQAFLTKKVSLRTNKPEA